MKVTLGMHGLQKTWQAEHEPIVKCHKCGGQARVMFVAHEGMEDEKESLYVCDIRENGGKGDYWPHDCISVAVYLCRKCFECIAVMNQG